MFAFLLSCQYIPLKKSCSITSWLSSFSHKFIHITVATWQRNSTKFTDLENQIGVRDALNSIYQIRGIFTTWWFLDTEGFSLKNSTITVYKPPTLFLWTMSLLFWWQLASTHLLQDWCVLPSDMGRDSWTDCLDHYDPYGQAQVNGWGGRASYSMSQSHSPCPNERDRRELHPVTF